MKRTLLLLASAILTLTSSAQNFEWAKTLSGTGSNYGYSIALDGAGNTYTTGYFQATADFDPGAGAFNLTSIGNSDIFISKLDASGNFVWAKQMGGTGFESGSSIALDAAGNIYITGFFQGTVDFDPGAGIFNLTSAGATDIFIMKLDASGNFLWAKRIGGNSTSGDYGNSIAVDGSGNVYTTGIFAGTMDFDPGAGTFNLTSAAYDVFISKLDTDGNFVYAKKMGGTATDYGNSIAVDGSDNVYITGYFNGTADFDPEAGTFNLTSAGGSDIFVAKLDASGNFVWAKQMGGTSAEQGNSLTTDGSGNIYTTGYFSGVADFDPGAATYDLSSAGNTDIFVAKLDASGNFVWAKQMGGTSGDDSFSVAVDGSGSVYTTGYFQGSADFNPGTATNTLTSTTGRDIFISKLDASGDFVWVKHIFGSCFSCNSFDEGRSIAIDASDNVHITGDFENTADFNTEGGTFNISSAGGKDVFILKLANCVNNSGVASITACNSYTWIDGITYTASNNTATHMLTNIGGCDSLVTLDLTINSTAAPTANSIQDLCTGATIDDINITGSSIQWYTSPSGGTPIASGTALTNGVYYASQTENNCESTVLTEVTVNISSPVAPTGPAQQNFCAYNTNTVADLDATGNNIQWYTTSTGGSPLAPSTSLTQQWYYASQTVNGCESSDRLASFVYVWLPDPLTPMYLAENLSFCPGATVADLKPQGSTWELNWYLSSNGGTALDPTTQLIDGTTYFGVRVIAGCESVVRYPVNVEVGPIDNTVSVSGILLTSNQNNAVYQWIDCNDNNNPIPFETYQSYNAVNQGDYAVIIELPNCTSQSDCITIGELSIAENELSFLKVYPNPATTALTVETDHIGSIRVEDLSGKLIIEISGSSSYNLDVSNFTSGIYFIRTQDGQTVKFIKE